MKGRQQGGGNGLQYIRLGAELRAAWNDGTFLLVLGLS